MAYRYDEEKAKSKEMNNSLDTTIIKVYVRHWRHIAPKMSIYLAEMYTFSGIR